MTKYPLQDNAFLPNVELKLHSCESNVLGPPEPHRNERVSMGLACVGQAIWEAALARWVLPIFCRRHTCKSKQASQRCFPDFQLCQPAKCCFWGRHSNYSNSIFWICTAWSQHKSSHCPCSFPMRTSGKCASPWMNMGTIRANLRESLAKKKLSTYGFYSSEIGSCKHKLFLTARKYIHEEELHVLAFLLQVYNVVKNTPSGSHLEQIDSW